MSGISFSGYVTSMPDHFLTQGFPGDPSAELTSFGCKGPPGEGQGMSERSDEIPTSPDRREQIP